MNAGILVAVATSIGDPSTVQLGLDVGTDHIAIQTIVAGGQVFLGGQGNSPLFEVSTKDANGASCTWTSTGAGGPLQMSTSGAYGQLRARLDGCAGVPPLDLKLSLEARSGHLELNGVITNNGFFGTPQWGWRGPVALGGAPSGARPVFASDAYIAALRSRAVYPDPYPPSPAPKSPREVRSEVFVIGFDGVIYRSWQSNDGPWTLPTPINDVAETRGIFPSGAPVAAVRRHDGQTDLFAVSAGTSGGAQLMTVFRREGHDWSEPLHLRDAEGPPLRPGSPLAALSIHEEADPHFNELEVYVASIDGRIYSYREYNDGSWDGADVAVDRLPVRRGSPTLFCSVPIDRPVHLAAIARNHRQRDLFFIDTRGRLCETFKLRSGERPPDARSPWAAPRAISGPVFTPGAPVAVAHGAGNTEHLFAIGNDRKIYETHEIDDGPWAQPRALPLAVAASSTASIVAARRSARDVVVSYVGADGGIFEMRSTGHPTDAGSGFLTMLGIPSIAGIATRKLALSLRAPEQLDLFSVAGPGDGRLWTNADGLGHIDDLRVVLPKLLFPGGALNGARGMIPVEMGTDSTLKRAGCGPAEDKGCFLGMPYHNEIGVPESTNIMELAQISKNGASLFLADVSPPIEGAAGRMPAQFNATLDEVSGTWTTESWPGTSTTLPSIVVGGYASSDWHPAVDAYVSAHAGDPALPDTPAWLRNAGAMLSTGGGAGGIYLSLGFRSVGGYGPGPAPAFASVLAGMHTSASALGTNVLYLVDWYQLDGTCKPGPYFCKGDYLVRTDLGGADGLKKAVEKAHQLGDHVILYVEPFIWGEGSNVMNLYENLYWARGTSGEPWIPFENTVALSYAHSGWADRLVQMTQRLVRDTSVDGIFLDSGPWRLNERVQTKDEIVRASPVEHARAFLELVDRVRAGIRAIKPDAVVLAETASGPALRHLDGGVSADFSPIFPSGAALAESFGPNQEMVGAALRATPARHGFPGANLFGNGTNLNQLNQVFAGGYNLALANDTGSIGGFIDRNTAYIQRLVTRRKVHADALVDGAQSDIPLRNAPSTLIARRYTPRVRRIVRREAITVVNFAPAGASASFDVSSVGGARGPEFCDVIAMKEYQAVGGRLVVDVPAVGEVCGGVGNCGLRVLVREKCSAEAN